MAFPARFRFRARPAVARFLALLLGSLAVPPEFAPSLAAAAFAPDRGSDTVSFQPVTGRKRALEVHKTVPAYMKRKHRISLYGTVADARASSSLAATL